jgi:hypothetical protein
MAGPWETKVALKMGPPTGRRLVGLSRTPAGVPKNKGPAPNRGGLRGGVEIKKSPPPVARTFGPAVMLQQHVDGWAQCCFE